MKNNIILYLSYITLGINDKAELQAQEIFKGLIDYGLLCNELLNKELVQAILVNDYHGDILSGYAMEFLLNSIIEQARKDLMGSFIGVDDEETQSSRYIIVKYDLDLVRGNKEKSLYGYVFNSIDDVAKYLESKLEIDGIGIQLGRKEKVLAREVLYDVLLKEGPYSETIAENFPENCASDVVFIQIHFDNGREASAEIYTVYEIGEYHQ